MDGRSSNEPREAIPGASPDQSQPRRLKQWKKHDGHPSLPLPACVSWIWPTSEELAGAYPPVPTSPPPSDKMVVLDGSHGEGGGQILRTALSLSLLTGRPFRITKIRANREKPGLRPQHLKAVQSASKLCDADVTGDAVGSRELTFRPKPYEPRDQEIDIGTAGSTSLVLQTLHLPLAMKASSAVRVVLKGGTFNPKAPAYLFLETTWKAYLKTFGMPVGLAMPSAGFYPKGGGQVDSWIEPATPSAWVQLDRGPLRRIRGIAGVANLRDEIAEKLRKQVLRRLADENLEPDVEIEIETLRWPSPGQGAAMTLIAEYEDAVPATFVGLGERGRPSEVVADEAVDELLAFDAVEHAAVDPYSADQIMLPLALAEGRSIYTVSDVTEHLRTNAATIRAFLDRTIEIHEPDDDQPPRVIIG